MNKKKNNSSRHTFPSVSMFKTRPSYKEVEKPPKNRFLSFVLLGSVIFFLFSLWQLNLEYSRLWSGTGELIKFISNMFPPDLSNWEKIMLAALESLQIALVGTVFGILLSLFLAFLAAENITPHLSISYGIKSMAAFVRAIPALVWALIFIVAVGMGPFPGILALAFNSIGMLVKVFAQSIEELDDGVLEAMKSTGANWLHMVFQGIIPSVLTALIAWCVFRFEINFRYATILGMVGAGGIGWELTSAMRVYRLQEAIFIIFLIFFMVFAAEMLGNRVKKLVKSN
ncbi:phosphonate ABC transporter, permease protein PhnE [Virgibacillus dokdonensis]|uniref:Phosphonate ABC transporter, permease protein PhnE n=1 Tax=Virgibacillus dokdonensis TaxID=302167 RepID=A0A3E0WPJ5_9BACI|nr:phosphonate ABC transporter, permease protein PhnE [Virgibacillus dokdonensis]RFA34319.1 phosphonate ABC transporter, permease protein PhnE [Virgibacillus dokdonensis]